LQGSFFIIIRFIQLFLIILYHIVLDKLL
jgi:hypothetical protein